MVSEIWIGGQVFSPQRPLVVAELGTSHNGDLGKAQEMAAAAAAAGAGCIKLQMVFADEILHPNTGEVALPGGRIRLYDRFKQLETPPEFYAEVKEYLESRGLIFLCTPFGLKSAAILRELGPGIVKIASPELNYTALLRETASWGLPALLSSGVSTLGDIERAVSIFREQRTMRDKRETGSGGLNLCLLHCVTAYPAPETDYNLRTLRSLAAVFGVPAGLSDHSLDPELVPALAVTQGAAVIEKHFCLSRSGSGLDDPIALPPDEFARMAKAVRQAAAEPDAALAALCRERGEALVEQVLGTGVKELAPSERANYRRTNRSIHALRDIGAGETLRPGDFAVLRTEKILRPGLEPCWEPFIAGRTARNNIPAGEGIRFEDI
jgi:sialic acid synthase SpsE